MQDDSTPKDNLIPYGYCQCGCGEKTAIAKANHTRHGYVKGQPLHFIRGHNRRRDETTRFFLKVSMPADGEGCWEWRGSHRGKGYGQFSNAMRKGVMAHRYAYELLRCDIPEGMHLDHLCRNPSCVNPWHLEPVTNAENVQRGDSAKLTTEDVRDIRRRYRRYSRDANTVTLAAEFGVSKNAVGHIVRGVTWDEERETA